MAKIEIRNRWTNALLYRHEADAPRNSPQRDALEAALSAGAKLSGANLSDADLSGADLSCADLSGADLSSAKLRDADLSGAKLRGAKLVSQRPLLGIGPIGSRCDYLTAYLTDAGIRVKSGCFFGDLDAFQAVVAEKHGDATVHAREYRAAIDLIKAHAELWSPVQEAQP